MGVKRGLPGDREPSSDEVLGDQMPVIWPSGVTSMRSAAGILGRAGMRTSEPVRATRKPGPLASSKSRTVMRKLRGRPRLVALSESEFWVLAMQMGR